MIGALVGYRVCCFGISVEVWYGGSQPRCIHGAEIRATYFI